MAEETPDVQQVQQQPENVYEVVSIEDVQSYIDYAVSDAVAALDSKRVTNADIETIGDVTANRASVEVAKALSEGAKGDAEGVQEVVATLDDAQWQKVRDEVKLGNTILWLNMLLTGALFGALLVSFFVKGWRR